MFFSKLLKELEEEDIKFSLLSSTSKILGVVWILFSF
jgi:hypothetical protein